MRVEATVPESRGQALVELAHQLGLTRSQIIDEALALFLKAVVEVRRGRRVVTIEPMSSTPACEMSTPTLTMLEWAAQRETIDLSPEAMTKVAQLVDSPPPPTPALTRVLARRRA
jgi:hypothetical protein